MSEGGGHMAERDRSSAEREAAGAPRKPDPTDRPGASGHRFGPDLACSECGILWDVHQREPSPCKTEAATDAFSRRPTSDFDPSPPASLAPASRSSSGGHDSSSDD